MAGHPRRPTWLGDQPFASVPRALLVHPHCRATHVRLHVALATLADFGTGEIPPTQPTALARLASLSFHTLRGYPPRQIHGVLPDLAAWAFLEDLAPGSALIHVRLLPPPPPPIGNQLALFRVARSDSHIQIARSPSFYTDSPDSPDSPEGVEPDGSPETSPTTNPPTSTTRGNWGVQLFVDEYRKVAGRDPLIDHKKIVGRHAKALENEGRPRSLIESLIRRIVAEGKSPGILPALVLEEELATSASRNGHKRVGLPITPREQWENASNVIR